LEPALLITLSPLADADPNEVEALLDASFGADRRGRTAYKLREGMQAIPELSFAAWEEDRMVGALQCWPIALHNDAGDTPLILVGPVAVDPERQQQGIGRAMMREMLTLAEDREALVLIGDPDIRPYRATRVFCAVVFALPVIPMALHVRLWW